MVENEFFDTSFRLIVRSTKPGVTVSSFSSLDVDHSFIKGPTKVHLFSTSSSSIPSFSVSPHHLRSRTNNVSFVYHCFPWLSRTLGATEIDSASVTRVGDEGREK